MRGGAENHKLHYKGKDEDFIIFVESPDAVKKWIADSSTPLVDVVTSFKIFVTHKQGAQGELSGASKAALENEFGSSEDEACIAKILRSGNLQTSSVSQFVRNSLQWDAIFPNVEDSKVDNKLINVQFGDRQGITNDSMSGDSSGRR